MKRPPRKRAKPKAVLVAPADDGGGGGDGNNDSSNTGARRGPGSGGSGSIGMKKSIGRYDALLRDVYNGDEGALDIIAAAQKRGEKSALKCMGKFYMQKSPTVALRYFEQAAAGSDGDPEAMYMVYSMHKQGIRARAPSTKHTVTAAPTGTGSCRRRRLHRRTRCAPQHLPQPRPHLTRHTHRPNTRRRTRSISRSNAIASSPIYIYFPVLFIGDGVIKKPDELNIWLKRSADAGYMDAQ